MQISVSGSPVAAGDPPEREKPIEHVEGIESAESLESLESSPASTLDSFVRKVARAPHLAMLPQPGQRVAGKYRIERLLGRGGMGAVFLAYSEALQKPVAIKLMLAQPGHTQGNLARFLREARLVAMIPNRHVVQVHDYGMIDDQPYIAMEYLVGCTLRDRLTERGRLTCEETARIVSQVCVALGRAHEAGLVHRDLKPENIFVAREGDEETVKVLDFGVAKATDALSDTTVDPTRTGALLGTPFYMSPEQAQGLKTVDFRTDLWAMGVVVFECLTGVRPFPAESFAPLVPQILFARIPSPSRVAPDAHLLPAIDGFVARALSRNPGERFASAQELAASFQAAVGTVEHAGSL
jgi:serine/threonine-protein kinase